MPATFLTPAGPGPFPAILYCHAHGNAWEIGRRELLEGRPALRCGPYGPVLTGAGFAVLCLDMPGHGERRAEGSESALTKAALWRARTLMGEMLADLRAGFEVLSAHPLVDAARIGTLGLSMGGTHAYWLAALEPRVAAVAHLCVLADMGPLIARGAHDLHGPYMTVPGLLADGDMGDVAGLVAPRPQLVVLGADDPLTPEAARQPALARLRAAYAHTGASAGLGIHVAPDAAHWETPGMRAEVMGFLAKSLGAPSAPQSSGAAPRGA